jgi:hypothetical protein
MAAGRSIRSSMWTPWRPLLVEIEAIRPAADLRFSRARPTSRT